jgi:dCMP deaminase
MSKDPSTKVGALVIGPAYDVRATGWNGAPRGCKADEDFRFQHRPEKYAWAAHAEANAIANAARTGTQIEGCVMLVTAPPCMECAKLIVQAGVSRVICPMPDPEFAERWAGHLTRARQLFAECGVEYVEFSE